MQRHRQTKAELVSKLGQVQTDWKDSSSESFLSYLHDFQPDDKIVREHIINLLERNYNSAILLFRLVLEQSKDEFAQTLNSLFYSSKAGSGKTAFIKDKDAYVTKLVELGLLDAMNSLTARSYTWKDVVQERLKSGRGSAIKGQRRGKNLEDFVEAIVSQVFTKFDIRKSFFGANGLTTAKADFCIPSKEQPSIVVEVKAYGATGSKQSDVIGDIKRIIDEKRRDTYFLLVTDGVTWTARMKDFERIIEFQNLGEIYRIYTQLMKDDLLSDLRQLKGELSL